MNRLVALTCFVMMVLSGFLSTQGGWNVLEGMVLAVIAGATLSIRTDFFAGWHFWAFVILIFVAYLLGYSLSLI